MKEQTKKTERKETATVVTVSQKAGQSLVRRTYPRTAPAPEITNKDQAGILFSQYLSTKTEEERKALLKSIGKVKK